MTKASNIKKKLDNCFSIHNWMVVEVEVFDLHPKHSVFRISYLVQNS